MNRRAFFGTLAAGLVLDPDRLLWVPGKKLISIPKPRLTQDDVLKLLLSDQEVVTFEGPTLAAYWRWVGYLAPLFTIGYPTEYKGIKLPPAYGGHAFGRLFWYSPGRVTASLQSPIMMRTTSVAR